jgi:general secretion pathway protein J
MRPRAQDQVRERRRVIADGSRLAPAALTGAPVSTTVERDAGFTLIEVLVALVILGFIVSGLAGGTQLGLAALGEQSRAVAEYGGLEPVDRALRRIVADIALPADNQLPGLVGDPRGFACLTSAPAAEDAGGMAPRVDAYVAANGTHQLVPRWSPHLHAGRIAPRPPPTEKVLLQGIDRVEVSYLSPDRSGWLGSWTRTTCPPWSASGCCSAPAIRAIGRRSSPPPGEAARVSRPVVRRSMAAPSQRNADQGFALLIVLWWTVLLTLLGTQLASSGRLEAQRAGNLRAAAAAEAAAEGVLHEAVFHVLDGSAAGCRADGVVHTVPVVGGTARVELRSEAAKIGLNQASPALLTALLTRLGVDAPIGHPRRRHPGLAHSDDTAAPAGRQGTGIPGDGPGLRSARQRFRDHRRTGIGPWHDTRAGGAPGPHVSVY